MFQIILTTLGITIGVVFTCWGLMMIASWFQSKDSKKLGSDRTYRVCEECRTNFYLTPIEVSFYLSHERPLPKRCRACKAERATERRVANY